MSTYSIVCAQSDHHSIFPGWWNILLSCCAKHIQNLFVRGPISGKWARHSVWYMTICSIFFSLAVVNVFRCSQLGSSRIELAVPFLDYLVKWRSSALATERRAMRRNAWEQGLNDKKSHKKCQGSLGSSVVAVICDAKGKKRILFIFFRWCQQILREHRMSLNLITYDLVESSHDYG